MNETKIKDLISCSSYLGSEIMVYPVSSVLTKAQTFFINKNNLERPLSSFSGGNSTLFSVPGFLLRLKLAAVLDPYLKKEYQLSQFYTYAIVSTISDFFNVLIRCPSEHYRQQFQSGNYLKFSLFYKDYIGHLGPFSF